MSASHKEQSFHPSYTHEPLSGTDCLLTKISAFWHEITTAGGEHAVVFTKQEQERLYGEILKACEL